MCGRYHITRPIAAMAEIFGFDERPNVPPGYNIAPTMPVPIVRPHDREDRLELSFVRWGLVPSWSKEPLRNPPLINARAETIWEKPSFRSSVRRRRCLMPCDGFWEWQRNIGGDPKRKQAYRVHRADDQMLVMGAIWEHWLGDDGSEIESCAIVTVPPNRAMAEIHHRMPVILGPDQWQEWLLGGDDLGGAETPDTFRNIDAMMSPCPSYWLSIYAVDNRVGSISHDDPGLLDPLERVQPTQDAANAVTAQPKQGNLF